MRDLIKNIYRTAALLALLNLVVLAGGIGYLVAAGKLDAERVQRIAAILRGAGDGAASEAQQTRTTAPTETARTTEAEIDRQVADEIRWRNTDRYRAQIEQRLKFINTVRMDVDRKREEFERMVKREEAERRQRLAEADRPGYDKELEIIGQLKPDVALQQLMSMSDSEAARVMFELDTRKVKKLFEAAKNDEQRAKLTTVRVLLRDMQPPERGASAMAQGGGAGS